MDLSAGTLFASLVVSCVGFGLFVYGRKQQRGPQLLTGVALMGFPYVVAGAVPILGIGAALVLAMVVALRAGL